MEVVGVKEEDAEHGQSMAQGAVPRDTAGTAGSTAEPLGCPSPGITEHINHSWAVWAAPYGIVTQMIGMLI